MNKSILTEIKRKGTGLTFIVNKYDILPTKAVEERIRIWTGETLKEITKDIEVILSHLISIGFGLQLSSCIVQKRIWLRLRHTQNQKY